MKNTKWPIIIFIVLQLLPVNAWPDDGTLTNSSDTSSSEKRLIKTISVQVASHKALQRAEKELIRLKSHGLAPFMRHELVPNKGMWYRIFVGRFEKMEDATKFAKKVKDQGIIRGFWVKRIEIPVDELKPPQTTAEKTDKTELKVDAEREKQTPPPKVTKMPAAVIPPKDEVWVPLPPAETPKVVIPPKDEVWVPLPPAETPKVVIPPKDIQEDRLILPAEDADKAKRIGKFSLGIKSSFFLPPKADEFLIQRTTGIDNRSWSFQDKIVYISLTSSYRLNAALLIEAGIEKAFFSYLDLWHLNLGPKIEFKKIGMLTPYAKGSLVIGHLEWDEAPGNFNSAWGWEGGLGISLIKSNIQIGFEAAYRGIKYDYNLPSEAEITATDSQLDFSGYALSATLCYWF